MKILEYSDVDLLSVLHLTMLGLNFPLTPEHAAHIRHTDPRPFPCFTVNAVEDNMALGQVGVFRLPMISTEGREDVGGVWAVSTHPNHARRGIASALLDEAHTRMRDAGLRFSTLGTSRSGVSHKLYQRHGYVDMNVWATAMTRWERAYQPTQLRAQPPGPEGYDFVEKIFADLASDYLGFAWRHTPFARLGDKVNPQEIWVLWENNAVVGYAFARKEKSILLINVQVLRTDISAAEAIAAIACELNALYVQVTTSRPSDMDSLRHAGWQVAHPDWSAFMIKPLLPDLTAEDARRLFGIGTDRFLISWLDTTWKHYISKEKELSRILYGTSSLINSAEAVPTGFEPAMVRTTPREIFTLSN
jgi:GNAT superfamily N-acetyltransferase